MPPVIAPAEAWPLAPTEKVAATCHVRSHVAEDRKLHNSSGRDVGTETCRVGPLMLYSLQHKKICRQFMLLCCRVPWGIQNLRTWQSRSLRARKAAICSPNSDPETSRQGRSKQHAILSIRSQETAGTAGIWQT